MLTRSDIEAARLRIAPFIRFTPVLEVLLPTPSGSLPVTLKLENLQVTGSFKPRGAFNSLMQIEGEHGVRLAIDELNT